MTYAFCTPAYVVLSGGRWAARVCALLLLQFSGTEDEEEYSPKQTPMPAHDSYTTQPYV